MRLHRTDEELLKEFRSTGDLELLGDLYSGYMHLVYGVCLKYLRDREEAKDSVMQIFEKLVIELPRHEVDNFKGWLYAVTRNFCLMKIRSDKAREKKFTEFANNPLIFMENEFQLHPVDDMAPELEKSLMDCIEKLRDEQKECVRLFYFGNRCYNEIATLMNTDENKIKSYLQNARRNLKICMEKKNEE